MFRRGFIGLNGGADFYAKDVDGLRHEGEISLHVDPELHEAAAIAAARTGKASIRGLLRRFGKRHGRNDGW